MSGNVKHISNKGTINRHKLTFDQTVAVTGIGPDHQIPAVGRSIRIGIKGYFRLSLSSSRSSDGNIVCTNHACPGSSAGPGAKGTVDVGISGIAVSIAVIGPDRQVLIVDRIICNRWIRLVIGIVGNLQVAGKNLRLTCSFGCGLCRRYSAATGGPPAIATDQRGEQNGSND